MEEKGIKHIKIDIRSRKSEKVRMRINEIQKGEYEVECPKQKEKS